MKILVIEDDPLQIEMIVEFLESLPGNTVTVIQTELEFQERLAEIEREPPDLFVIDVILRWTDPQPNAQRPPKEVAEGGRERAGFRCHTRLLEQDATREVPIILYSHLDGTHFERQLRALPPSTLYLQKDSDFAPLLDAIRTLIPGSFDTAG
jgi:CheY-like chemotaxis protein